MFADFNLLIYSLEIFFCILCFFSGVRFVLVMKVFISLKALLFYFFLFLCFLFRYIYILHNVSLHLKTVLSTKEE